MADLPSALTATTSVVGAVASAAAWDGGEGWLRTTLARLEANRDLVFGVLRERVPVLTGRPPEGTYMAWLQASGTLAASGDPRGVLLREAGVDLAEGKPFGDESGARVRMSFACPQATLEEALDAIAVACERLSDYA